MNTHRIKIETLTPIHIGSGIKFKPNFEYLNFNEERKLVILDESKILEIIGPENIQQWVNIIDKQEDLLFYLRQRKKNIAPADIAKRKISIVGNAPQSQSELREHLSTNCELNLLLPGSSIKGSIRTSILKYLINKEPDFASVSDNFISKGNRPYVNDSQIVAKYLGGRFDNKKQQYLLDANRDFMRMIRIGDGIFKVESEGRKLEVINQKRGGWEIKERESSFIECIPAKSVTNANLQIPYKLLERIEESRENRTEYIKLNKDLLDLKTLFSIVNSYTKELLEDEIEQWEEDNPPEIGDYLKNLSLLHKTITDLSENECVLRVGAGSGWHFMTGGWTTNSDLVDDDARWKIKRATRNGKTYRDEEIKFPKTRKLIEGGTPLGFIKIALIDQS